jgi:hypothetical protein
VSTQQPERFQRLLSRAVREIAYLENKTMQRVQDELGHALGRSSGSCIDYWRRGHVPANLTDLEKLAQIIAARKGLPSREIEQLVLSAEPFYPRAHLDQLLPGLNGAGPATVPALFTGGVKRPFSPFIVGPPITHPRHFFGREPELQRIFGWWRRQPLQNVAIVGPKRSGKTSLLHYLHQITRTPSPQLRPGQKQDWLADPDHFRWVLIDFQDPRLTRLERLLSYLLTQLALPIPTPCTLDNFMDAVSGRIHQPTIILMDELIAGLEAPELETTFWWSLRALVSHYTNGNLAFVLTAHDIPMQLAEVQGKPSPFFNLFNTLSLGPLQETAARELIATAPQPFSSADIAWILEQSRLWPALLQILCQTRLDALEGSLPANVNWQAEGKRQIGQYHYLLQTA